MRLTKLQVAIATAAITATSLAACSSPEGESSDGGSSSEVLRVGLYGGTWLEAVKDTAAAEFEKRTGATVQYVEGNPSDLATQIYAADGQGTDVPMDVIETDSLTQTQLAQRELLVPTDDYADEDTFGDVTAEPINDGLAPPHCDWYVVLAYNTEAFADLGLDAPTSWEDFFAPELDGKVSFPDISVAQSAATIAAAAGVASGDPTDFAAGIEQLGQADPYSIYRASSDMQSDMANGNVIAAASADGRAWQLVDEGLPIEVVYAQVPGTEEVGPQAGQCFLDVVKGSENADLAAEFIAASYSAKVQTDFARATGYTPTSPASLEELAKDPKWEDRVQDPSEVVTLDWQQYAADAQDIVDSFTRTLGG
jgi:spermidine/putrescine-binding protein